MAAGKNAGPIMLLFYNLGITFIPAPYAKCDLIHWASTPWEPDLGSVLGAVHGSILNGPQGTQRGLLRLGQAPDARDIEALVGPVTPQRLQQLAALEIPDVDDTIIPATGEPAAIRAALERLDRPLMRLSHSHALSLLQVPPAQHAIAAATQQHHAGRAPGQRIHDRPTGRCLWSPPTPAPPADSSQWPETFHPDSTPRHRRRRRCSQGPARVAHRFPCSRPTAGRHCPTRYWPGADHQDSMSPHRCSSYGRAVP